MTLHHPTERSRSRSCEYGETRFSAVRHGGSSQGKGVHSFLKPLRERRAVRTVTRALDIPAVEGPIQPLGTWLSTDVRQDRLSPQGHFKVSTNYTRHQDMGHHVALEKPGVVVYERAAASISNSVGGPASAMRPSHARS